MAVLYDSDMNKLDQQTFEFESTKTTANIVTPDDQAQTGDVIVIETNGEQCDDTNLLHITYNLGRRCYNQLIYLGLIIVVTFVLIYFSICHCLPCKLLSCCFECCEKCIKSYQDRRLERVKRIEECEIQEERQAHREKVNSFQLQIDEILNREESLTAEDIEFIKKRK